MSNITKEQQLEIKRHSLSHILAIAVLDMFPEAKLGIGPAIENGFYYDFELPRTLIPEDLEILEGKMKEMVKANHSFEKKDISIAEAIEHFEKANQSYKIELIKELEAKGEKTVSVYKSGPLVDLCAGPHLDSTGEIDPTSFKLQKISGAYWKGDEKRPMLQRIYGLAFANKKELKEHLHLLEEAEKRDHRKIGKELELFMISEEVGKGLPLWLPKGAFIRRRLEDYMYELERKSGYSFVHTPVLASENLYKISGHLSHYKDDMYNPIDIEGEKYYLKPMNCPHHHIMFRNTLHSYRELPIRFSDFSPIHRFERSGVLTGLIRARCFSQNDAHIYCMKNQIEAEIINVLAMFRKVYTDFNIKDYWFRLSLPDFNNKEKYGDIENKELWETSANYARQALEKSGEKYVEAEGEAAFYGPKIDVQIKNALGKEDTIATMQIDFYMPERFNLEYVNEKGEKERPVIIHRAIMGSFDRFFAFLVEQTAGAFPTWLAPVQVSIIPVSDKFNNYAKQVEAEMRQAGVQVVLNDSAESLGKRIREAEKQKIPYMLVVGEKEVADGTVAVRKRGEKDQPVMKKEEFMEMILQEIKEKK